MRRLPTLLFRFVVSAALVIALLIGVDGGGAMTRLAGASPAWLVVAIAALTAQTVLIAVRWRLVAGRIGLRIGMRHAVGEYYLAQLVNMTLPGGVVGDVSRAARARGGAGLGAAARSVVLERFAGQVAMGAVLATALAVSLSVPGGIDWPRGTAPLLIACLAGLGAAACAARPVLRRLGLAGVAHRALFARDILPRQAILGLAIVALNLAAFASCAAATGSALGLGATATLVPLILSAMLIPVSVGGWGWREGAAAALFPLAGHDPAAGLAASVAFGAILLAASLPGAVWPLLMRRDLPEADARPTSLADPGN